MREESSDNPLTLQYMSSAKRVCMDAIAKPGSHRAKILQSLPFPMISVESLQHDSVLVCTLYKACFAWLLCQTCPNRFWVDQEVPRLL